MATVAAYFDAPHCVAGDGAGAGGFGAAARGVALAVVEERLLNPLLQCPCRHCGDVFM